jgi:hypothetical protein
MAASQLSNSASVNQIPSQTTFQHLRNQLGVTPMRCAPNHVGWRLAAAFVRWYGTISPEARALAHAFLMALFVAAILIRLLIVFGQ